MGIPLKMTIEDFKMVLDGSNLNSNSIDFLRKIFVEGVDFKIASELCDLQKSRPYQLKKQFEILLNKKLHEQNIEPVIKLVPANTRKPVL